MVMYHLDPLPDVAPAEMHAILRFGNPIGEFWRADEIPEGCRRHFVPIDEARIAEILKERADDNKRPAG